MEDLDFVTSSYSKPVVAPVATEEAVSLTDSPEEFITLERAASTDDNSSAEETILLSPSDEDDDSRTEETTLESLSDEEVEALYIYHMASMRTRNPSGKDQRKAKRLFYRLKCKGRWDPNRGRKQLQKAGFGVPPKGSL